MVLERGNHILGVKGLAVVEFDALAQVERPLGGVRRHVPGFGDFGHQLTVIGHFGQLVVDRAADELHVKVFEGSGIEGIGGRTVADSQSQSAALVGSCRRCGFGPEQRCRARADAERRGIDHELTTGDTFTVK